MAEMTMDTQRARRRLIASIIGITLLGVPGCGSLPWPGGGPTLTLDQTAAAQVLDRWLQLMDSSQTALGVRLDSHTTRIGTVNGTRLSGPVLAAGGVPSDQNVISWHWTVSDPLLGHGSRGGDATVRGIHVEESHRVLSTADQANGVQWDGQVKVTFAAAVGSGAFSDDSRPVSVLQKNGHWLLAPSSPTADWFAGTRVHPSTQLWAPTGAAAHAMSDSLRSEAQSHEVIQYGGTVEHQGSGTGATCGGRNRLGGDDYTVLIPDGSDIRGASIEWTSGTFHGAGSYTATAYSTRSGAGPGSGTVLGLPPEFSQPTNDQSVTITLGKDLRTGSVKYTGHLTGEQTTYDGTLVHIQQVTYTDEYDATWICSPTLTGP